MGNSVTSGRPSTSSRSNRAVTTRRTANRELSATFVSPNSASSAPPVALTTTIAPAPQTATTSPEETSIDPTTIVDGGYLIPFGVYSNSPYSIATTREGEQMESLAADLALVDPSPLAITAHSSAAVPPHSTGTSTAGDYEQMLMIVQRLIIQRKLAPFYQGLDEIPAVAANYDAAVETVVKLRPPPKYQSIALSRRNRILSERRSDRTSRIFASLIGLVSGGDNHLTADSAIRGSDAVGTKDNAGQQEDLTASQLLRVDTSQLYQGAVECPICFLSYPQNINYSRCCEQPICTECFVEIKRAPDGAPAVCPYCVEPNFGVVYHHSNFSRERRATFIDSSEQTGMAITTATAEQQPADESTTSNIRARAQTDSANTPSSTRQSFGVHAPGVVLSDDIRPHVLREIRRRQSMAAEAARLVSAAISSNERIVSRRAFRRLQNQPMSSETMARRATAGGVLALSEDMSEVNRQGPAYFTHLRNMTDELEELMLNEAIRQSLQDEGDRRRREERAAYLVPAAHRSQYGETNVNTTHNDDDDDDDDDDDTPLSVIAANRNE